MKLVLNFLIDEHLMVVEVHQEGTGWVVDRWNEPNWINGEYYESLDGIVEMAIATFRKS